MAKKYGFSFSWKRSLGVSSAKAKISRATGIPLTKSGRQRKIGRIVSGNTGCLLQALIIVGTFVLSFAGIIHLANFSK